MAKVILFAGGMLIMLTAAALGDNQNLRRLSSAEIQLALPGRYFFYSPTGWADAAVHEEFHRNGKWKGIRYSRGPVRFEGRWRIAEDKICVRADQGRSGPYNENWFCRNVWKDVHTDQLLMTHLIYRGDPLALTEGTLQY